MSTNSDPDFETIELVTRPTGSTQFYLFNLFADYILPAGGRIWTHDLLQLLALLGVGEAAARTTLSRMKQQGWFASERVGRRSRYLLTQRGKAILREGDQRIFEPPLVDWDGRWQLVVYTLPEEKRKLRNSLRKKLIWFGYGRLAPGTWISPHDRQADLAAVVDELAIGEHVVIFDGRPQPSSAFVARCWDLAALAADYGHFIERYQPQFERLQREALPSPEQCFVQRFWLTYQFQRFPLKDPNLPAALLPADWVGRRARALFLAYRERLQHGIGDYIEQRVIV